MAPLSQHAYPVILLHKGSTHEAYQFAKRGATLFKGSVRLLESVLKIASNGVSANPQVAETLQALARTYDAHTKQIWLAPLCVEELQTRVKYMRCVVRRVAGAAIEIQTLLGKYETASKGHLWTNRDSRESMSEVHDQLWQLNEHCLEAVLLWQGHPEEIIQIQQKIDALLKAAGQHMIVANTALDAVEKFHLSATTIIRAIERTGLLP